MWRALLPAEHIGELGMADNFWAMGDTGPCGRCSEIYYDRGPRCPGHRRLRRRTSNPGANASSRSGTTCSWSSTRDADGHADAAAGAIDRHRHGARAHLGGHARHAVELRHTAVHADAAARSASARDWPIPRRMAASDVSMRVIADHARATTFLIADGVVPSNECRGYVLRKIMRRAMRHGRKLGMHEPFLFSLVDVLVHRDGRRVSRVGGGTRCHRQGDQERRRALRRGADGRACRGSRRRLERAAPRIKVVSGDEAFKLYDTYGLPRDFIEDLASASGLALRRAKASTARWQGQREKARAGSAFGGGKARSSRSRRTTRASRCVRPATPSRATPARP